ncbi:MAG: hypothetical protein JWM68_4376 [Verrucomicrobiales bacterium]|nr:hypothetical protein [Verrucomicrobiales bacterium]
MKINYLFASLLGVSMAACTTVNTVERAQPVAQKQMIADKRVLTDAGLARGASIVGVNESSTPDGFLKVQVEILNRTRSLKHFSYRFEWFDQNGMLVNTPTSTSIPRQIEGQESLFITAIAPTPLAKDFRVKLIEDNR